MLKSNFDYKIYFKSFSSKYKQILYLIIIFLPWNRHFYNEGGGGCLKNNSHAHVWKLMRKILFFVLIKENEFCRRRRRQTFLANFLQIFRLFN